MHLIFIILRVKGKKFTKITLAVTYASLLMDLHTILITKSTPLFSEVTILIRFCSFFVQKCYFSSLLLNAFVQSPLGCDFHFKVWLESVKQLGSTFCFFVCFREQGRLFCAKISQNRSLMQFAQKH